SYHSRDENVQPHVQLTTALYVSCVKWLTASLKNENGIAPTEKGRSLPRMSPADHSYVRLAQFLRFDAMANEDFVFDLHALPEAASVQVRSADVAVVQEVIHTLIGVAMLWIL